MPTEPYPRACLASAVLVLQGGSFGASAAYRFRLLGTALCDGHEESDSVAEATEVREQYGPFLRGKILSLMGALQARCM